MFENIDNEHIDELNQETEKIKRASRADKLDTHRTLAALYKLLHSSDEFSEELPVAAGTSKEASLT